MFIGHFGTGFGAKTIDKKLSLGTLFLAAQFIDLLWPFFLIFGIEKVKIVQSNSPFLNLDFVYYPFSHSLFGVIIWAILFGGVYFLIKRNFKSALLLAALVISHWVLDLVSHIPDLPLSIWGNTKVGLGLWNSTIFTILIETAIFFLGLYYYLRSTKPNNKKGSIGLWGLTAFLIITYVMSIISPPPPNESAIGYTGLSQWILIIWAYWVSNNRSTADEFVPTIVSADI